VFLEKLRKYLEGSTDSTHPTRTLSWMSHLYMAFVEWVMKMRPRKFVFERT